MVARHALPARRPGVPKDASLAEALLRRAAERGNAGAAFQLGIAQLSGAEGIAANKSEGALWVHVPQCVD